MQIDAGKAVTADRRGASLGLHPRWLAHAYRQATGEGLHDTILRRRVEKAVNLLRGTDQSIADIAFSVGFAIDATIREMIDALPEDAWQPAINGDGSERHGAQVVPPGLTSIDANHEGVAETAVGLLHRQMAGWTGPAEHVVAPVRLVVRGSTRGGA